MESVDPIDATIAQQLLGTFRKNYKRPPLSVSAREQMIRNICNKLQQDAA